ncbi:PAS domain-containing protein [Kordiimonas marina]|uniref:PAS domain-containing protein n=1 Tax=Kordiimonas marina TaxID=2872312 RepID=UPI001FF220CE|nr:PAS domain-containing protein [Kordiimonas marina]MCJ9430556.1 PAS domain-containing protein [Kordiimonas marina]
MTLSPFNRLSAEPGRAGLDLPDFSIFDAEDLRRDDREIDTLLSYFEARTEGKRLPKRADVDPAKLKAFLPDICIHRALYGEDGTLKDIVVQLIGTEVASFYGEMTGKSVREHPAPEVAQRIFISGQTCIDRRRPIVAIAKALSSKKNHLQVNILYIPLSEDGEQIDRLFLLVRVRGRGL